MYQALDEARHGQALGSHEEQGEASLVEGLFGRGALGSVLGAGQHGRRRAVGQEAADLIGHEGDERADDHRQPLARQGRRLVAEALPAAGGEHDQGVPSLQGGRQGLLLVGKQGFESEHPAHDLADGFQVRGGGGG